MKPVDAVKNRRLRVGFLPGNFPWEKSPPKAGKLLSVGAVMRNMTHALNQFADVVPFQTESDSDLALAHFLKQIDVLWADVYAGSRNQR